MEGFGGSHSEGAFFLKAALNGCPAGLVRPLGDAVYGWIGSAGHSPSIEDNGVVGDIKANRRCEQEPLLGIATCNEAKECASGVAQEVQAHRHDMPIAIGKRRIEPEIRHWAM